jgi:hypothetical protein
MFNLGTLCFSWQHKITNTPTKLKPSKGFPSYLRRSKVLLFDLNFKAHQQLSYASLESWLAMKPTMWSPMWSLPSQCRDFTCLFSCFPEIIPLISDINLNPFSQEHLVWLLPYLLTLSWLSLLIVFLVLLKMFLDLGINDSLTFLRDMIFMSVRPQTKPGK